MKKAIPVILLLALLAGCKFVRQYQLGGAAVSVEGHSLCHADLQRLTKGAPTPQDSARIADNYIRNWATDILMYENAKRAADDPKRLEALVEDYRRSLFVYEYEQQLVEQRMPKHIEPDSIRRFYDLYPERFVLRENLVKGLFIVLPADAPETERLKTLLLNLDEQAMEQIEKYAYQYASGYELFADRWQTLHNILLRMPADDRDLTSALRSDALVERQDSATLYLLRITDRRLAGEPMPLEYARPEIEKILLSRRQVGFLSRQKAELYDNALKQGKIVFNRTNNNDTE